MFASPTSSRKASAHGQININGVKDGVLLLPHNRYRMVLQVSSLNFELKSDDEQDAIIETYESFLNSIGFPLQILIRTREVDLDKYLDDLKQRLEAETEQVYRDQLDAYDGFIRGLIQTNKILTHVFYVILPYDSDAKTEFDAIREQLAIRLDIVRKGLARMGMHSRELASLEILDLFYSFYSPEQAKLQPLTAQALSLVHSEYIQKEQYS